MPSAFEQRARAYHSSCQLRIADDQRIKDQRGFVAPGVLEVLQQQRFDQVVTRVKAGQLGGRGRHDLWPQIQRFHGFLPEAPAIATCLDGPWYLHQILRNSFTSAINTSVEGKFFSRSRITARGSLVATE